MNAVLGEKVQRVAVLLGPVAVIDPGGDAVVQPQATHLPKADRQQREVRIEKVVDHVVVVERLVGAVPAGVLQPAPRISSTVGGQNQIGERTLIHAVSPSLADQSALRAAFDAQMTEDIEEHPVESVLHFVGQARYRLCVVGVEERAWESELERRECELVRISFQNDL